MGRSAQAKRTRQEQPLGRVSTILRILNYFKEFNENPFPGRSTRQCSEKNKVFSDKREQALERIMGRVDDDGLNVGITITAGGHLEGAPSQAAELERRRPAMWELLKGRRTEMYAVYEKNSARPCRGTHG